MKKDLLPALLLLCLCFISCSSDDNTISEPEENFFGLKVGNTWVYEYYRRQNPQEAMYDATGVKDSVEVTGTQMINGNEFFAYRIRTSGNDSNSPFYFENGERTYYFRDSLGYLIADNGAVIFSREDEQEFFLYEGGVYPVYTARGETTEIVATEAGQFDCEYMDIYARDENGEVLPGSDKKYFAAGIGEIISTTSFVSDPIPVVERRLLSYDVQQ